LRILLFTFLMLLSAPVLMLETFSPIQVGKGTVVGEKESGGSLRTVVDDSDTWDEHTCLSRAIYFESKGESDRGKILVAQTTVNRMNSDKRYFPNTICQVVKQKIGKRCTYSWFCDGKSDKPKDLIQYKKSETIATNAINGKYKGVTKALYFKRCSAINRFFDKLKYLGKEGNHCFFDEH